MVKRKSPEETRQCGIDLNAQETSCCNVEAIIPVDARGQIVLPKDLREKAQIKAGDKFTVISWVAGGKVCCISLVKTDDFADTVKSTLGPILKEIVKE